MVLLTFGKVKQRNSFRSVPFPLNKKTAIQSKNTSNMHHNPIHRKEECAIISFNLINIQVVRRPTLSRARNQRDETPLSPTEASQSYLWEGDYKRKKRPQPSVLLVRSQYKGNVEQKQAHPTCPVFLLPKRKRKSLNKPRNPAHSAAPLLP